MRDNSRIITALAETGDPRPEAWLQTPAGKLPQHYGNVAQELEAATAGVAVRDLSHHGRLRLQGPDHAEFLHRMSTQHVSDLKPGEGADAVFVENRGRIMDLVSLHRGGDFTMVVVSPAQAGTLLEWLERYHFAEDMTIQDVTAATSQLELIGPGAAEMARQLGWPLDGVAPGHTVRTASTDEPWTIRADRCGHPAMQATAAPAPTASLWEQLCKRGAQPLGEAAWEILRLQFGVPAHGSELTLDHNPWEAGLSHAVHMSKGCYIGQEVIARLDAYDKVKQRMVGLTWDGAGSLVPGAVVSSGQRPVGSITSAAFAPHLDCGLALAYVKRGFWDAGTQLEAGAGNGTRAVRVSDFALAG
jgi:folate-binding protein YgfZ